MFRWQMFKYKKKNTDTKNLLISGTRYYHNQLKITNSLPTVERDIDKGIMISRVSEYFLEPVASYTTQEFIQYFYKTMPIDLQASPPSYMNGILKYKINQYGIDKLLFMTDLYSQHCQESNNIFNLGEWDKYSHIADEHMDNIKSIFAENNNYYTLKQRRLFDV